MKCGYLILFILCLSTSAIADLESGISSEKKVKKIVLAISNSLPPYNMIEENIPEFPGIQVEIVNRVFSRLGRTLEWRTMTNNRAINELTLGNIDGAVNFSSIVGEGKKVKYYDSLAINTFEVCLIGAEREEKRFKNINNFYSEFKKNQKIRLIGFQNAAYVFKNVLPNLNEYKNYDEVPHQKILAASLVAGRANYILSDYLVYEYYAKKLKQALFKERNEAFTCIYKIPSTPRGVSFLDDSVRAIFDAELKKMINSGERDKILKKYQRFL